MTLGQRLTRLMAGAGLAGLAMIALGLAATNGAAAPAGGPPTSANYLPIIFQSALATPAAFLPVVLVPPKPTPTGTPLPVTPPAATDWQTVLQYYRASAHLPPLAINPGWNSGAASHAHYMVSNDVLANTEMTGTPWYSAAGATEAANSNLMLSDNVATTDQQALDFWMAKPFHALGVLDPALLTTGFGSYRQDDGPFDPYRMGAVLDVRQGLGGIPFSTNFPIKWPDHNTTVYLTSYDGNEEPDPLTSCPGYTAPSGLPIVVQAGPGGSSIVVGAHAIRQGSTDLPHCTFTADTYTNTIDPGLQTLGRQILAASDAIVLIPQSPLTHGLAYTVSMVINGQTVEWTFHVAP